MMGDEEFRVYLNALACRHLRYLQLSRRHLHFPGEFQHELEELIRLCQLARMGAASPGDGELIKMIAKRLKDREYQLRHAIEAMEQAGVLDAIDEDPATLFSNVRISALPPEDKELLGQTGHSAPDAELVLITEYSRTHLARDRYQERKPSAIIRDAPGAVERAVGQLAEPEEGDVATNSVPEKKKRKICNGIGKILQGGVLGVGNILVGAGSIVAPNPAIAAGVIASGAIAVGSICQGLGDLRGE
jgi:hypothetical protein